MSDSWCRRRWKYAKKFNAIVMTLNWWAEVFYFEEKLDSGRVPNPYIWRKLKVLMLRETSFEFFLVY